MEVVTRTPCSTQAEMQAASDGCAEAFKTWGTTSVMTRQGIMYGVPRFARTPNPRYPPYPPLDSTFIFWTALLRCIPSRPAPPPIHSTVVSRFSSFGADVASNNNVLVGPGSSSLTCSARIRPKSPRASRSSRARPSPTLRATYSGASRSPSTRVASRAC